MFALPEPCLVPIVLVPSALDSSLCCTDQRCCICLETFSACAWWREGWMRVWNSHKGFWLSFVFGNPPLVASCAKSLPVEAFGKVWPFSWRISTSPSKGSPGLACSAVSIKYYAILYYVLYYGGGTELMLTVSAGCWLRAWSCTSCMSRRFIRAPLCECLQS